MNSLKNLKTTKEQTMNSNNPSFDTLLSAFGVHDPDKIQKLQMLSSMMNQQNSVEHMSANNSETQEQRKAFRRRIMKIQHEHRFLKEQNESLAAALGACPDCWGQKSSCRTRYGQGTPGNGEIDEREFYALVVPVLRKLQIVKDENGDDEIKNSIK